MNHRAVIRVASARNRHPAGGVAYCFAAMNGAGDYERADAPTGGTVGDAARALAPPRLSCLAADGLLSWALPGEPVPAGFPPTGTRT
jgi:hypothetical protein